MRNPNYPPADELADVSVRASESLREPSAPESIERMAEVLRSNPSTDAGQAVFESLGRLAETGHNRPIIELWVRVRDPRLTALLSEQGWINDFPAYLKVFRALESGDMRPIKNGGAEIVGPLMDAAQLDENPLSRAASECLRTLTAPFAVDEICARWSRDRADWVRAIIAERGYVARTPPDALVLSALAADKPDRIRESGPEVARSILDACRDSDPVIASRALQLLSDLRNQSIMDALCEIWAHERPSELDSAISEYGYVASSPSLVRTLSAIKSRRTDCLESDPKSLHSLVIATTDHDPQIREDAQEILLQLASSPDAMDELCRVAVEHGSAVAGKLAMDLGYRPSDVGTRALFYFLTEQWEEYESLDFDMSLLREAYDKAGKDLRSRIARCARRAGRLEMIELVAGLRHKRHMGEMTSREWEVTLSLIDERSDWETLWRLAVGAPAVWAVKALYRLEEVQWRPEDNGDLEGFRRLLACAKSCTGEAPILGVADSPTAHFQAHGRRVSGLILNSYFHSTLVTGSWDGSACVWRMPDGKPLAKLSGHRHPVTSLAAVPDGSLLATACGAERTVLLWRMPEGALDRRLRGHVKGVASMAISADGRLLAAGCNDGICRLWRLADAELLASLRGHKKTVRCVSFSPDKSTLVTGGEDGMIRTWDVSTCVMRNQWTAHNPNVRALAFNPSGTLLASGGSDGHVSIWDMDRDVELSRLEGHTHLVDALAISGDGRVLASGSWDRTVRLWIMPDGRPWGKLERHSGPVTCLTTDPESRILVSGSHDCNVVIWNFQSGVFRRPMTRSDLETVEQLAQGQANPSEQAWLEFLIAQMRWRWRFDIELDQTPTQIQVGEFDIEIEG